MTVSRRLLTATLAPLALLLGAMSTVPDEAPAAAPAAEAPAAQPPADALATEASAAATAEAAEELGLLPPGPVPARQSAPPIAQMRPLPRKEDWLARTRQENGRLVLKPADKGPERTLTLDPVLQARLTKLLKDYNVPYGAAVVIEPSTGRVLAMAEHSEAQPELRGLTTRAVYPAASIFKVVTGSALLEAGVSPEAETCFHGGKRRLSAKHLQDSERDGSCYSLGLAMGKSANVVFAKLTHRHLSTESLRRMAARYRFNRELASPFPTEVSLAHIPEEPFELANTGAGFGDVYLSPLHGALLASVAANGGVWRDPVFFEPDPAEAAPVAPAEPERIMSEEAARALTDMLEETVTRGTARHIFHERGFRVDDAVGKTGSLADKKPFRDYSWFVGFAPKHNPRVAVAAVIVNGPIWRIRGTYLGREALRLGLERVPEPVLLTAPAGSAGQH